MFWLLMRTRLLSGRNVVLETWRNRPVVAMSLGVTGICLFGGMFLGFLFFFQFAKGAGVLPETIYQAFYYLFLLLFAGAVPFVASTLFQSADYSLLFAAPIPPRTVVAAKLLDATITNSLQFTIIGLPAIVAGAFALRLSRLAVAACPAAHRAVRAAARPADRPCPAACPRRVGHGAAAGRDYPCQCADGHWRVRDLCAGSA